MKKLIFITMLFLSLTVLADLRNTHFSGEWGGRSYSITISTFGINGFWGDQNYNYNVNKIFNDRVVIRKSNDHNSKIDINVRDPFLMARGKVNCGDIDLYVNGFFLGGDICGKKSTAYYFNSKEASENFKFIVVSYFFRDFPTPLILPVIHTLFAR